MDCSKYVIRGAYPDKNPTYKCGCGTEYKSDSKYNYCSVCGAYLKDMLNALALKAEQEIKGRAERSRALAEQFKVDVFNELGIPNEDFSLYIDIDVLFDHFCTKYASYLTPNYAQVFHAFKEIVELDCVDAPKKNVNQHGDNQCF